MPGNFKFLFTPLQLRSVSIPNRIFQPAHGKGFDEHVENFSIYGRRDLCYLVERAKGGAGLLIAGEQIVHPTSGGPGGIREMPHAYREEIIPRYKMIADEVHKYGTKIVAQLSHVGIMTSGDNQDDLHQVWAPSTISLVESHFGVAKEMEPEDIQEVIAGFAKSTRNVRQGGLDGVELHGAHSYLIHQFLSSASNRRADKYGGDLTNRMRFLMEIIDAVREALGEDLILGVRLSGDDFMSNGLTLDESRQIAKAIEESRKVDYISVSAGTQWNANSLGITIPSYLYPTGLLVPYAAAIKTVARKTAVLCVGAITTPAFAERILSQGQADMAGICRGLIADPEFPNKAKEGRTDDIRGCIRCLQGCLTRSATALPLSCIQNPAAGREERLGMGTLEPAREIKKVIVIGGGPAGLKAAEIAARRKHKVVLYEEKDQLGGQVRMASVAPLRQEFLEIVRYLETQVRKLGVTVKTSHVATVDDVLGERPDVVVVATGCKPILTRFDKPTFSEKTVPGVEQSNVLSVWDVLKDKRKAGRKVVLVDGDGHQRNLVVADYLSADKDRRVEIVTESRNVLPSRTHPLVAAQLAKRMSERGIKAHLGTQVKEIKGDRVVLLCSGKESSIEGVDTIIWATGARANDSLYFDLKGKVKELHRIGDCVAPRWVDFAIWEGEQVGRAI